MDRQSTIGFLLIAVILVLWMWWSSPKQMPQQNQKAFTEQVKDSARVQKQNTPAPVQAVTANAAKDTLGKYFASSSAGIEQTITIETELYRAVLSTRGGAIKSWELKKFSTWDKHPVQLINNHNGGELNLLFSTTDGKLINTRDLYFTVTLPPSRRIELNGNDEYTVNFLLPAGNGTIVKSLRFKNKSYAFDAVVTMKGMGGIIANYEYQIIWENGLKNTEYNSVDEAQSVKAYSFAGGEVTDIDATKDAEIPTSNTSGTTDWIATRTKYFGLAILTNDKKTSGAYLEGRHKTMANSGVVKEYSLGMKIPFKGSAEETASLHVYFGPLDFDLIRAYGRGLDNILSMGWSWIRPLNLYIFIPLFQFLHMFIPNYGIVIILFSLLIRVALHPLNKSSLKAMKKMQALQPLMEEIREKYKNEPAKMNEQVMKLYKDYGVNPAGGCLPMLLQLPILYALYTLFTTSIELRHANFAWWITDLSAPDNILTLPFTVPLFGVHAISGLALLMGITMFIQQKMSVQDPRQKAMVWMMPVMMTLLFNNFPSGLNLYYFVFNLLAIGQQVMMNKTGGQVTLQKVTEKKRAGGIMNALSKNLPKLPKR